MSRIRSGARQAAVAVVFVLVFALYPGGVFATAQAAARHEQLPRQPGRTAVRWHVLSLRNGWSAGPSDDGGEPRVAISDGVVYLAGAMYQVGRPGRQWFATLPTGLRPGHNLWLPVFTFGFAGSLEVAASGRMIASGRWASSFTSLAGISFPVRSVRLHTLSLLDGWVSSQSEFDSGDPAAGIQNGVVYLAGSMHLASGTGNQVAVLPTGLRPARNMWFLIYTYNGTTGDMLIDGEGRIYVFGGVANAYTSLAGISFPVASVRFHHLRLLNGWVPGAAWLGGALRAGVQHGIAYLAGGLGQPSGTNDHVATLPRTLRPGRTMWMLAETAGGAVATLEIASTGQIRAVGGNARTYTAFAGISFPTGR